MHQGFPLSLYHIVWYLLQTRTPLPGIQYCWMLKAEHLYHASVQSTTLHISHQTLCAHSTRPSAIIVCRQLKLHSATTVYSQHKPRPIVPTTSTPISPQTPENPGKQWELSQTHPPAVLPLFLLSQSLLQLLSFCLSIIFLKTQMTNTVNVSYALASFSSSSPLSKPG